MKRFSDGMEFGLSKCAKATIKRGQLESSDNVRLDEETMIKDLVKKKFINALALMSLVEFNTA